MIAPRKRHVHFVGIGGCGTSGVARLVLETGDRVSGSDLRSSALGRDLAALGATVHEGHDSSHLGQDVDLVVRSAAVSEENPEVAAARARGIPVYKYAEALGWLMEGREGIAIAGTHGKTTTSALTASTLLHAGVDPMFLVGGIVAEVGTNARHGAGPFVVEACEFDRSFLHLRPRVGVILNIDDDHLDCYGSLAEIEAAFVSFAERITDDGLLLLHDSVARLAGRLRRRVRVETFGHSVAALWRARDEVRVDGESRFEVLRHGMSHGMFRIGLPGRHNVANALVPIAVSHDLGIDPETTASCLARFEGVNRRLQLRVQGPGYRLYDDYAHHPTEVAATLRAMRDVHPEQALSVVFQPHQYGRTRMLLERFAEALLVADRVIVADIYRARDREEDVRSVCGEDLAAAIRSRGGDALHMASFMRIADRLEREMRVGTVAVTMGAGNIDEVADEMARRLGG